MSDTAASSTTANQERSAKKAHVFHGEGLVLQNRFKGWWAKARKSEEPPTPQEFLENFGMAKETRTQALWKCFHDEFFRDEPGRTDYYAHHLRDCLGGTWDPHNVFADVDPLDIVLEKGPNQSRHTEDDIKSLIEIVQLEDLHVCSCIRQNYSHDLVDFLFQQIPDDRLKIVSVRSWEDPHLRQVLDGSLMAVFQKHLPRIQKSLNFNFTGGWTEAAFKCCVGMMTQKNVPPRWRLWAPGDYVASNLIEPEGPKDAETPCSQSSASENGEATGIEALNIHLSGNAAANSLVLESLPKLLHLRELKCHGSLSSSSPILATVIENATKLETLQISGHSNPQTDSCLLCVLEALKKNTSLTSFTILGDGKEGTNLYKQKVLEILRDSNTTLRYSYVGTADYVRIEDTVQKRIEYYLYLNRSGRGTVRSETLTVSEFVPLLCIVNEKYRKEKRLLRKSWRQGMHYRNPEYWGNAINRLFGLLRERPGMWSLAGAAVDTKECGKKRRVDNATDQKVAKAWKV